MHSDEYNALSSSLDALEDYMTKLAQDLAALTHRVEKIEEAA